VIELILICSWVGNHLTGVWMSIANMAAYNCSLGLWLGYVAVKRPARNEAQSLLQPQRWEQSLTDLHNPVPADSLIPLFEGMVDRALSRAQQELPSVPLAREPAHAAQGAAASASGFRGVTAPAIPRKK
jgi:hypothetical protein